MNARFRLPGLGATIFFAGVALAGCSRNPTLVDIRVSADATVPPVSVLRITLQQPGGQRSNLYRSLLSDTDSSAEPFRFPVTIAFNFAGASQAPATITVDALGDSTDYRLVASGTASVDVEPQRTVDADLMLNVATLNPPAGDGGSDDAGVPPPDATVEEPTDAVEVNGDGDGDGDGDGVVTGDAGSEDDDAGGPPDTLLTMGPLANRTARK